MNRFWTETELASVGRWQAEGVQLIEQGRRLGRTRQSVANAITRYDLAGHPAQCKPERDARILALAHAGHGATWIAPAVGLSRERTKDILIAFARRGVLRRIARGQYRLTKRWRG